MKLVVPSSGSMTHWNSGASAGARARLLGEEAVFRVGAADDVDDRLLGRLVHLRDEVIAVLGADIEPACQRGAVDERAGAARGFHRDIEHRMHVLF